MTVTSIGEDPAGPAILTDHAGRALRLRYVSDNGTPTLAGGCAFPPPPPASPPWPEPAEFTTSLLCPPGAVAAQLTHSYLPAFHLAWDIVHASLDEWDADDRDAAAIAQAILDVVPGATTSHQPGHRRIHGPSFEISVATRIQLGDPFGRIRLRCDDLQPTVARQLAAYLTACHTTPTEPAARPAGWRPWRRTRRGGETTAQ